MGHVARTGQMRYARKFLLEKLKGSDNSEELGVDGKTIL
jgi:hypothetical protein